MSEKVSIKIAKELVEKIQKLINRSPEEFTNVEEYVEFVLTEVLNEESKPVYSPEEEEEIKKRLRSLGYIS